MLSMRHRLLLLVKTPKAAKSLQSLLLHTLHALQSSCIRLTCLSGPSATPIQYEKPQRTKGVLIQRVMVANSLQTSHGTEPTQLAASQATREHQASQRSRGSNHPETRRSRRDLNPSETPKNPRTLGADCVLKWPDWSSLPLGGAKSRWPRDDSGSRRTPRRLRTARNGRAA